MPIRRTLKNVVKNYSDSQIKVREATSNDPWGPSSTLMSEIADLTYNVVAFTEIMQMVWKRLNDHGKNWRHVYKALVLLDYLIKTGSEKVAQQCKENIFAIQTLKDFQYIEDGKDHGMNVRERAKQLVTLLKDDERLKNERAKALKAKERFAQSAGGVGSTTSTTATRHGSGSPTMHSSYTESFGSGTEMEAARPSTAGEEELQLQLALAMSKEEHDEDQKRRKADEIKYQLAIEESKKEQDSEQRRILAQDQPPKSSLLELAQGGLDPWGGPPPAAEPAPDPWAPPVPAKSTASPWQPGSQPPPLSTPNNDPWAPNDMETSKPVVSDPWTGGPSGPPSRGTSPWGSPANQPTNGTSAGPPTGGIDDEFDLLSSTRTKSPQTTMPENNGNALMGGSTDPWDLTNVTSSLEEQRPKTKSPADFLGENANLVNLDNLVTKPAPASATNPFALTLSQPAENPFQNTQPPRIPMNQMVTSTSMGFEQTTANNSSTILPTPLLAPGAGGPPPMAAPLQPQSLNPFL